MIGTTTSHAYPETQARLPPTQSRPHKRNSPDLVRPGLIVVLNGTSSSGKSSIVEQLRVLAADRFFLHIELDAFRAMEPPDYFGTAQREQAGLRIRALCSAMQAAAAAYSSNGQNVVLDHVLSPEAWSCLLQDPGMNDALLVKVSCELEETEVRERQRGNRALGLARNQMPSIRLGRLYDFEVDTTNASPGQAAAQVAQWLSLSPRPSALQAMRAGHT